MTTLDPPIALSLLALAHPPDTASTIHLSKVLQRPLHLHPTPALANAQQQRRHTRAAHLLALKKKHKPAPLSARQKRRRCLYDVPRAAQRYAVYAGLHRLWVGYMREILWEDGGAWRPVGQGALARVCAADFHGAEVEVVRSRCVGRVGVRGIVVRDLRGVFEVVTRGDGVKTLPKEGTVFRFAVPVPGERGEEGEEAEGGEGIEKVEQQEEKKEVVFELHGNQFQHRATDRATKKFRAHYLPDL